MSKQYYNNPASVGGAKAAEFVKAVRDLKNKAIELNALIKATTNDSNNVEYIDKVESVPGAHWGFWTVAEGSGKGASFRTPLVAITAKIIEISDDNLADLDMG